MKIILVTFQNVTWAMEQTGLSYDELLDMLNDSKAKDYPLTVECPSS